MNSKVNKNGDSNYFQKENVIVSFHCFKLCTTLHQLLHQEILL